MWLDRYTVLCRECPDLVAVYESADGRLAVLLHHTLVPLTQEHSRWHADTRSGAGIMVGKLRAAGFRDGVVVLQWLPFGEAAEIMRTWPCRYEGDSARRAQLTAVAERFAADERFLVSRVRFQRQTAPPTKGVRPPFGASAEELLALRRWYDAMAPCWLEIEPLFRRALVLRTHRWIADRVLVPVGNGDAPPLKDLVVGTGLWRTLVELIPPGEIGAWRPWIRLVIRDLEWALRRPVAQWNQAWVRGLFLIAYSIPTPSPTGRSGSGVGRAARVGRLIPGAKPPLLVLSPRPARGA